MTGIGALSACADSASETVAPPLQDTQEALNLARHKQATEEAAFGWVDDATLRELSKVSTIGDSDADYKTLSATHFDNCYWNEGRDWVIANRNAAIDYAIQYRNTGQKALLHAFFDAVGFLIHATQDFYAHSNWAETHEPGQLAPFNEPGAPVPPGWYSGTYDNPGDTGPDAGAAHCPPGTPTHAEMNKDVVGRPHSDEAMFDAILATTDQLSRLVAGIRAAMPGDDADAVLGAVGFVAPLPAYTHERADFVRAVALQGADRGFTTPPLFCPSGSYVGSYSQRVDLHGNDSTGLNSVMFQCVADSGDLTLMLAWSGLSGTWSEVRACASVGAFIQGGELKVEPLVSIRDNLGATAARFVCDDTTALSADNDDPHGAWTGVARCGDREAVCGMQVTYQPPQEIRDDTAMNGLTLLCCATR